MYQLQDSPLVAELTVGVRYEFSVPQAAEQWRARTFMASMQMEKLPTQLAFVKFIAPLLSEAKRLLWINVPFWEWKEANEGQEQLTDR